MESRDDVLPLDCYPLILLTGKKHAGKKVLAHQYIKQEKDKFQEASKQEIKIDANSYIYAYTRAGVFSICYLDVFCNPQILFSYIFKRLHSESIFTNTKSVFICTDIHLCPKKWQVYLYKLTEVYLEIKVILTTETISMIHEGILNRFQIIRVPDRGYFQEPSVQCDVLAKDVRNEVHSLLTNLIEPKEVLKTITKHFLELPHVKEHSKNVRYVLQQANDTAHVLSNCNEFYVQFCLETFLLKIQIYCN